MAGVNPNLLLEAEEVSLGGPPPQAASSATNYYENMEELLLVDSVDYSSQNVAVLSILLALALIANPTPTSKRLYTTLLINALKREINVSIVNGIIDTNSLNR